MSVLLTNYRSAYSTRSAVTRIDRGSEHLDSLMRTLQDDEFRRAPVIYDFPPEPDSEVSEYSLDKRNIGSLARDYALPKGRRHIGSVARDYGLPSGKRNLGALARQSMLPLSGKRNIASLARYYTLPQGGKRNVATLARDSSLPYGKRYLGSLARTGGYPMREYDEDKRSIASLARSGDWPGVVKRGGVAGKLASTVRVLLNKFNRKGRSLNEDREVNNEPLDLQQLVRQYDDGDDEAKKTGNWQATALSVPEDLQDTKAKNKSNRRLDATSQARHKRQIDFSDEYPLPVMQNANVLDYEDLIETLSDHYPNAEKRFMGE